MRVIRRTVLKNLKPENTLNKLFLYFTQEYRHGFSKIIYSLFIRGLWHLRFIIFLEVNFDDNEKENRLIQWESSISDKCTAIEEEIERHKIENLLHENTEKYFCLE